MKLATGLATCIFFFWFHVDFLLFCVWFRVVGGVYGMLGLSIRKKHPHRQLLSFLVRDK